MISADFPSAKPTGNVYLDTLIAGGSFAAGAGQKTTITWALGGGGVLEYIPGTYVTTAAWRGYEVQALKAALQQWGNVCNIEFLSATSKAQADLVEYLGTKSDPVYGSGVAGSHDLPDGETSVPLKGVYMWNTYEWSKTGLLQGGQGFSLLLHELGHALGLVHPHADTAKDEAFPGVSNAQDLGDNNLNQSVWTVMSYISGWDQEPIPDSATNAAYGDAGTPMAFDIAAIQAIYGANMSYRTGDDTYVLPTQNDSGTFWNCLWDAGGTDTLSNAAGKLDCIIDLKEAPLTGEHAGGYVSHAPGIAGGYTIAQGALIENAVGGAGDDSLIGNAGDNRLTGGVGADTLEGGAGNDFLDGGAGADALDGGSGIDTAWYHQDWWKYYFTLEEEGIRVHWVDDPGGATELVKGVEFFRFGEGAAQVEVASPDLFANHAPALNVPLEDQVLTAGDDFFYVDYLSSFIEVDADDVLSFTFTQVDASGTVLGTGSLPDWLTLFDELLEGLPEQSDAGTYYLRVTATDLHQISTVDTFSITVIAPATEDDDLILGSSKDDVLQGLQGNDTLSGGDGFDTVSYAESEAGVKVDLGKKTAKGGAGNDTLVGFEKCIGSEYGDTLTGDTGDNDLLGQAGNDVLRGGKGDDTLTGGLGRDLLTGGQGGDIFVFSTDSVADQAQGWYDTLTDFQSGKDKLVFDTLAAADGSPGYSALSRSESVMFHSGEDVTHAVAAGQILIYNRSSGMLYYDVDGVGGADANPVCQFVGTPQITFADFVFIE